MKFNFDKRYLKLCKYIGVTTVIIYLAFRLIDSIPFLYDNILKFLGGFWDITFPILLGSIIAFLMYGPANAIAKGLMKIKFLSEKKSICRRNHSFLFGSPWAFDCTSLWGLFYDWWSDFTEQYHQQHFGIHN